MTQHEPPTGHPRARPAGDDADVIVVGAGPGGSSAAYHLAQAGLDVLLLEKSHLPAGEGLRRRADPAGGQAARRHGRGAGARRRLVPRTRACGSSAAGPGSSCDWPELTSYPDFGLVRTRRDFDEIAGPARRSRQAPGCWKGVTVTGPVLDGERPDHRGHRAATGGDAEAGAERAYRARLVVAADGNSSRLSLAMGLSKRDDRPLGVAVRTYYTSPRHDDDYLEIVAGAVGRRRGCCPATAGSSASATAPATSGLGMLNTSYRLRPHRLPGPAAPLAGGDARRVGLHRGEPGPSRSAAPRCRWASTAPRTTPGGCCWSGTRAAWSTRSTARASPTRWSPARSPPR